MDGTTIAAWAFAEQADEWDLAGVSARAIADADGYVVTGEKRFVEAGDAADLFLVTASSEHGPVQVVVRRGADGVTVTPRRSVDLVRRFADVDLVAVHVGAADVVSRPHDATAAVAHQRRLALALQVAEVVGMMDRVFEMTLEYMQDRWTFGRPLASYQALKHRIADQLLVLETAKGCAEAATEAVGTDALDAEEVVAVAKAYVGQHSIEMLSECVQLHGGIGVTWEHDLHVFGRRAALARSVMGSPERHQERLCDLLAPTMSASA
jgi:alkylation response protein AidB-like acyl-CoA dehydrogenase